MENSLIGTLTDVDNSTIHHCFYTVKPPVKSSFTILNKKSQIKEENMNSFT